MNKTLKGGLAAVAGGALLLGGTGSLAYWTGTSNVDGADSNSGKLEMGAPDCDEDSVVGTHGWHFDSDDAVFDQVNDTLVPGDKLTKVCDITLTMVGEHMGAT